MYWEIYINAQGIQCQLKLGKDPDSIADEQKEWIDGKRARIILLFEHPNLREIESISGDYYKSSDIYQDFMNQKLYNIAQKQGVGDTMRMRNAFEYRTSSIKPECIGIIAELDDADDYDEFNKNYSSIEGAIQALYSTRSIVYGASSDPTKSILKWIKRLKVEEE